MRNDELAAAQAYVRLLEATRAALADPDDGPLYVPLLASPIAEADGALQRPASAATSPGSSTW